MYIVNAERSQEKNDRNVHATLYQSHLRESRAQKNLRERIAKRSFVARRQLKSVVQSTSARERLLAFAIAHRCFQAFPAIYNERRFLTSIAWESVENVTQEGAHLWLVRTKL
jgi:hypothetical protein